MNCRRQHNCTKYNMIDGHRARGEGEKRENRAVDFGASETHIRRANERTRERKREMNAWEHAHVQKRERERYTLSTYMNIYRI